jgi:hypothetical protein
MFKYFFGRSTATAVTAPSATVKKQDVFVPQYPAQEVFEKYHGVPHEEYLSKAKEALEEFLTASNDDFFSVRTLEGRTRKIKSHLTVSISGDQIKIEAPTDGFSYSIKPTKWGTDSVTGNRDRFWFFDDRTLSECDVVRML